ncbi:hypothetical protein EW146_g9177 [Bondarzewia mesenterica]|uniref:cellulase n=1 Tax=Bondarzewia mesenterica TaxID=1095465 RepID=A0A4S4L8W6_9AGAM|nr:hypothetical protein EW146_g9177 [Bondarzewia mesenterica]
MDSSQLAASSRQEDVLSSTAANGTISPEGGSRRNAAYDPDATGLNCWSREKPVEPRNSPTTHRAHSVKQERTPRRPSISSTRGPSSAVPMSSVSPPKMQPPMVTINAGSPPATLNYIAEKASYLQAGSGSTGSGSGSSSWGHHRKGLSIDKMGFGKIFGSGSNVIVHISETPDRADKICSISHYAQASARDRDMTRPCFAATGHGSLTTTNPSSLPPLSSPSLSNADTHNIVDIIEVSLRDGLQNEHGIIPPEFKIELVDRLARAGVSTVDVGSFPTSIMLTGVVRSFSLILSSTIILPPSPGTDVAAGTSAAFAACSNLYANCSLSSNTAFSSPASLQNASYASTLLTHAQQLYAFTQNASGGQQVNQMAVLKVSTAYSSSSYSNELTMAALMLAWETNSSDLYTQAGAYYA